MMRRIRFGSQNFVWFSKCSY